LILRFCQKYLIAVATVSVFFAPGVISKPELPLNTSVAPVKVALATGAKTVSAGQKINVMVLMEIQPGWHIYYKDPGDTGLPTQVLWELPEGFTAEPLQWQPYQRFVESGIKTKGYENKTAISAAIIAPAQLRPGQSARIKATVKWLACKHSCVPGSAVVMLSLPVR